MLEIIVTFEKEKKHLFLLSSILTKNMPKPPPHNKTPHFKRPLWGNGATKGGGQMGNCPL